MPRSGAEGLGASKLNSIQYLRAVAAAGVVLLHASSSLTDDRPVAPFLIGDNGVDLFFVISGFVIFYTTADDRMSLLRFLQRRVIRIVPIYYLLTTVGFLFAVALPNFSRTFTPEPIDYVRSLLFIPYTNRILSTVRPELILGWTLNYEMFFYLVFGLALVLAARTRLVVLIVLFAVLAALGAILNPANPILATYTNPLLLEFVFGTVIGYVASSRPALLGRIGLVFAGAAVGVGLMALWRYDAVTSQRVAAAGIPCAAIVALGLWLEKTGVVPTLPWLALVGDASYSLYLTHLFTLGVLRRLWPPIFDPERPSTQLIFMAVALVVAALVAIGFYLLVERPITRWLVDRVKRGERPPAAVA